MPVIVYHDSSRLTQEDEIFNQTLKSKFSLFKSLLMNLVEGGQDGSINFEHAKRIASYAQDTFFKHLRLYDFVFKNTKLTEVKRIKLPLFEPSCGLPLSTALVRDDKVTKVYFDDETEILSDHDQAND